jgi:glycerophosphoryl diester phosphodiesterase
LKRPRANANFWDPTNFPRPLVASEMGFGVPAGVAENTVAAFALGLSLGAAAVEVTARLTADGLVALHHNAVATNGRVVSKSNFSDLPKGTVAAVPPARWRAPLQVPSCSRRQLHRGLHCQLHYQPHYYQLRPCVLAPASSSTV